MKCCRVLIAALLLLGSQAMASQPNIVFIIGDDMERYMFNCLPEFAGQNLSPNLDRIATEGVAFPEFHAVSAACTPSRFNVLTGRYGSRAGGALAASIKQHDLALVGFNTEIESGDMNIGRYLQQAGYKTGFVGKNHVVPAPGYGTGGIPNWADPRDPAIKRKLQANGRALESAIRSVGFDYAASIYHRNPIQMKPKVLAVHNMEWITKGGLDFIDQYKDEPFFLYFSTTLTHSPYGAKQSWNANPLATPYGMLDAPLNVLPDRSTIPARLAAAGIKEHGTWIRDALRPHLLAFDDAIGALFDKLEEHGLDDNTIIIFFNDHGMGTKASVYEGGTLAMSMVWRKEGFPKCTGQDAFISNVDFAPTILDYAGAQVPDDAFDGKSFRPLLEGQAQSHRSSVYSEMGCARAIRVGHWKYVAVHYPKSIKDPVSNRVGQFSLRPSRTANGLERNVMNLHPGYFDAHQLYDLSKDPLETKNLAASPEHASRLADMQKELLKYLNLLPGGFGDLKTTNDELPSGTVESD